MSRRSPGSRGKVDPNNNISSKFANSPYLNRVQPPKQKEQSKKEKEEKPRRRIIKRSSAESVKSYVTHQSIRSSKTRQSSGLSRARISILLPSEVDKLLSAFFSKHKHDGHPLLVHNPETKIGSSDDSTIASATSIDDNRVFRECREGPTVTLEAAVDDDISDLDSVLSDTKQND